MLLGESADVDFGASVVASEAKWTSSICRVSAVSLAIVKGHIGQLNDIVMIEVGQ